MARSAKKDAAPEVLPPVEAKEAGAPPRFHALAVAKSGEFYAALKLTIQGDKVIASEVLRHGTLHALAWEKFRVAGINLFSSPKRLRENAP